MKSLDGTSSEAVARRRGRPVVTTHGRIEQAAFRLFERHGFDGTTMDAIAQDVGVGTRTLFRYFPSKNDIPWGQFANSLARFRQMLDELPPDVPVHEAVHRGVTAFNTFPPDARPSHRERMRLILTTPELRAHSVHQYARWREVIAEYVARRIEARPTDLVPRMAGQVSLALALTAYEVWLDEEDADLMVSLDACLLELRRFLDVGRAADASPPRYQGE